MKHLSKYIFPFLLILLFCKNDTCALTIPADTIRQKKVNGIKVKPYKVQSKDTWVSISKKNKVSVAYLKTVNSGIENLKTGQIINVPIEEGTVTKDQVVTYTQTVVDDPEPPGSSKYKEAVYHVIKKGETMFRVAKMYNQSVENIQEWNNLKGSDLKVDQKIIVNYIYKYKKEPAVTPSDLPHDKKKQEDKEPEEFGTSQKINNQANRFDVKKDTRNGVVESSDQLIASSEKNSTVLPEIKGAATTSHATTSIHKSPNGLVIKPVNESGVAAWIMDGELNQNKYYALHRHAPVGTIVKVTNRMNGKYVFVKVVGLLPDTGDNDNLIIKISQAASNKINVLDSKFQADLSYGLAE